MNALLLLNRKVVTERDKLGASLRREVAVPFGCKSASYDELRLGYGPVMEAVPLTGQRAVWPSRVLVDADRRRPCPSARDLREGRAPRAIAGIQQELTDDSRLEGVARALPVIGLCLARTSAPSSREPLGLGPTRRSPSSPHLNGHAIQRVRWRLFSAQFTCVTPPASCRWSSPRSQSADQAEHHGVVSALERRARGSDNGCRGGG